jgi:cadmium resistance protein CadD (predicted permease)
MLLTAAITLLALAGMSGPVVAGLNSPEDRRTVGAHALATVAVAVAGLLAAFLATRLPAPLIGLVGLFPVIGGLRRLTSRPFTSQLRRDYPPGAGSLAVAFLALLVTRTGGEIAVAEAVLAVVAVAQVLVARALPAGPLRHGETLAAWTEVALGAYLLVDGRALSMLRPF